MDQYDRNLLGKLVSEAAVYHFPVRSGVFGSSESVWIVECRICSSISIQFRMSSGISVGTYSGAGDDGPTVAYRATVDGPGASLAGVHGSSASYGPGTGSAYYPFGTGTARSFPESDGVTGQTSQRHQDTGAGHQSSCSVMESPAARRHLVSARYAGSCDDNLTCGGIYQPCSQQQQQQHAHMMAAAGEPSFVCSVWTPENGYASYVVDPRSGATIARLVQI